MKIERKIKKRKKIMKKLKKIPPNFQIKEDVPVDEEAKKKN